METDERFISEKKAVTVGKHYFQVELQTPVLSSETLEVRQREAVGILRSLLREE